MCGTSFCHSRARGEEVNVEGMWKPLARSTTPAPGRPGGAPGSATAHNIGEAELDERLAAYADAPGFAVDLAQQVEREIHIHALDVPTRAPSQRQVEVRRQIGPRVVEAIQRRRADRASQIGTALLLPAGRDGLK